ncbi:hypothetical protein [Helicobacter sp. T3_23-1056]
MKIVIANTDSMVEKLIEACAKKTGLKVQHFISLEEIDVSMLEDCFLFVDENALGGDTKRAKQIGSGSLSCLIYSRRKPLDEFKYLVQKPFLPTQVLEILRKELVRRGEDISRVVEEDNDKKAPIEPIKDIPLNEFDLKDEHLFEGNLELPPLPDTDAVETKTSAQSAKEQKEQDELQNDEENFLDVGENIAHKSLAALERGQSEQGGISDETGNDASSEISTDMPNDSVAQSLTESLVGELTEVNALGGESSDSSDGLSSDLGGDLALDGIGDTSQTPDSAGDIRDSLAGGLDDSLDSLGSLDNLDNLASADLALDLESADNLKPVNSMKGNLAGVGALDNSLDSALDSSLDSALESSMDSADLGGGESSLDFSAGSNVGSNVDFANVDSVEGGDLATQNQSSESSATSEKDELLGGDGLEDLSSLGADAQTDLQTDLPDLDGNIADSADIAQDIQESNTQETSKQDTNETQTNDLQETQEAQSSPDFAANGGVLDKDEAQMIQELLNGDSQDKPKSSQASNETAISQSAQTSQEAESINAKEQEGAQENAHQETLQQEAKHQKNTQEDSTQESSAQEITQEFSESSEAKTAEAIDDFAELNENDIMEVLGEESTNENAENATNAPNVMDKQATTQQEPQESQTPQEMAKESSTQDTQEVAQESSLKPSADNEADLSENVAEDAKSTIASEIDESTQSTEQSIETTQDDIAGTTAEAEGIAEKTAEMDKSAESTPQKAEISTDEASALDGIDNVGGANENAEVGDIGGEVLKDLQDNLAKDLEKGLADELALQNDLVEGMPPSPTQEGAQEKNAEQEDSAERVNRQLKELDSSLEQDLANDIDKTSESMAEDLANDAESSGLEASDLGNSDLAEGDLCDEVASENVELPKSLEELESLVDSSEGDLGGLDKLDSIIDSSDADLSADLAGDKLDSSMQTSADSSLDFVPQSSVAQYLNIDESGTQDCLAKVAQNDSTKSTQKRLITELLANKSAEEISSLLEGAHIHIDIDFSQK